jgi:methanethiol S-methyltransferase
MGRLREAAAHTMAWLGGVAFVLSLACFVYSYFISFSDSVTTGPGSAAIATDFALFTTFALHHSVLARSGAKRWIASITGPRAERSMYVWVASVLFIAVCVLWQPVPGDFYQHRGILAGLHWAVVAAGAWLTLRAAGVLDPLELAGIRQIRGDLEPPRFRVVGPYKYLRHPIYLGWVLLVFGVPEMNGTRLAFAAISTAYLVFAIPFEERSLIEVFGDQYRAYQRAVRWRIVPGVW